MPSNTTIIYVTIRLDSQIKDQILNCFFNGKTRDEIVKEVGVSGGTVSAIIKEEKKMIKAVDFEEVRHFAKMVGKSEMTIEQCSIGYRLYNLLKILGIEDSEDKQRRKKKVVTIQILKIITTMNY
jgi:hypothetical protein